jgi:hypothetical protein
LWRLRRRLRSGLRLRWWLPMWWRRLPMRRWLRLLPGLRRLWRLRRLHRLWRLRWRLLLVVGRLRALLDFEARQQAIMEPPGRNRRAAGLMPAS